MNWGTCKSGSNNIHFDSPPIMADGRNFASWQPGAQISDNIRKEANIDTNWKYRQFMTNNADKIILQNQLEACDQCCACPARFSNNNSSTPNTPYLYKSCIDSNEPYGYESSDLKNIYLSSYQLQCRLHTPALTQEQLLAAKYPNWN